MAETKEQVTRKLKPEVEDKLAALRGHIRSMVGRMMLTNDVNQFVRKGCILVDELELTLREK